jgi:hypothetical protein
MSDFKPGDEFMSVQRRGLSVCVCPDVFLAYTRIFGSQGKSGFSFHREETPGTVLGFKNVARQLQ